MKKIFRLALSSLLLAGLLNLTGCNEVGEPTASGSGTVAPETKPTEGTKPIKPTDKPVEPETEKPTNKVELEKYSFNKNHIQYNLKDGKEMPAEYEIYVYHWGSGFEASFVKASGNEVMLDSRLEGALIALVKVGMEPSFTDGSILCQTENLRINANELLFEYTEGPKQVKYTFNYDLIKKNMSNPDALTGSYDTYIYYWGARGGSRFVKVNNGEVMLPEGITGCLFAAVKPGMTPNFDDGSVIDKTADIKVTDTNITLPEKEEAKPEMQEYSFILEQAEWNIAEGKPAVPEDGYELYVHYWGEGFNPSWAKVEGNKVVLDKRATGALIAYVKTGMDASWDNVITQTTDMKVVDNTLVFLVTEKPDAPVMVEYAIDVTQAEWNIAEGKPQAPKEGFDLYVWYWGDGLNGGFAKIVDGKVSLNVKATGALVAYVEAGKVPEWNKTTLTQTTNLKFVEKTLEFAITEKPDAPVMVEYTIDVTPAEWNIAEGKPAAPKEGFDLYVWYWGDGLNGGFAKIVDGKVSLDAKATGALVAYVEAGKTPEWDKTTLTQTTDLKFVEKVLVFAVTEKPADPETPATGEYTFILEQAQWNIPSDKPAIPTEGFELYVHYWGNGFNASWAKATGNKVTLDKRVEGALLAYVKTGMTPDWPNVITQTTNMTVVENTLVFTVTEKPADPVFEDYTIDIAPAEWNIENGKKPAPADGYELYVYYWFNNGATNAFVKIVDGKVSLDNRVEGALVAYVKTGMEANWDNTITQTTNLTITEHVLGYKITEKPVEPEPVLAEYTFILEQAQWNIPSDKPAIPTEGFDLYVHYWGTGFNASWAKATGNKVTLDSRVTGALLAYVKAGMEANWDNTITQTTDMKVVDNTLVFAVTEKPADPVMEEYTFIVEQAAWNILEGKAAAPADGYDLYIYYWFNEGKTKAFVKAVDGKVSLDNRVEGALVAYIKTGMEANWKNTITQTTDMKVVDNTLVFGVTEKPEAPEPEAPVTEEYTIDIAPAAWNILDGKKPAPADGYDLYVYYWFNSGKTNAFVKIVDGKVNLDNRVEGALVAYVKAGMEATWENTITQTTHLVITNNVLGYAIAEKPVEPQPEKPVVPADIEYTIDVTLAEYNIENGHPEAPKDGYDLYVWYWSDVFEHRFAKIVDGKVTLDNRATGALVVYIKAGSAPLWGSDTVLTQTTNLVINENTLTFAVNEKPAPTPEGGNEGGTTTPEVENPANL